MKKLLLIASLLTALPFAAMADGVQTVTIDGVATGLQVVRITFSGDDVTLTLADNSQVSYGMERVEISFGQTLGVEAPKVDAPSASSRIYTLGGQYVGNSLETLPHGVYIVDGKKTVK